MAALRSAWAASASEEEKRAAEVVLDHNAPVLTCPACGAVFETGPAECPDCGLGLL